MVDWPAETPGEIPVGRTARGDDIRVARAASTVGKAHEDKFKKSM